MLLRNSWKLRVSKRNVFDAGNGFAGMKRLVFVSLLFSAVIGACMPALTPSQVYPSPISEADLQLTAAVLSQQTLQSLPTNTISPSETPIVNTPSATFAATATETSNPALETLTATLLALNITSEDTPAITEAIGTLSEEVDIQQGSITPSVTATIGNPQPITHGTLPPNLPSGRIILFNKSHAEAYVSFRCVTKEGYVTYLEYPVKKNFSISAPAGECIYTAWVGGRQFSGGFSLSVDKSRTITFYKDKVQVTNEK